MYLKPRYDGPTILTLNWPDLDVLTPLARQRRRMEELARRFSDDDWNTTSRCEGWTVRDVYAHLVSINPMYELSALCGVAGEPTRLLTEFCPAVTPPEMVEALGPLSNAEVLERFVDTNTSLINALSALTPTDWDKSAESPVGHVAIRALCLHALWDSWVHERDVCKPLGLTQSVEDDEVTASLHYIAGLSPAFSLGAGRDYPGTFVVAATNPDFEFTVAVSDHVTVTPGVLEPGGHVLSGDAAELVDALTTRQPLPEEAPLEWDWLLNGLKTAWNLPLIDEDLRPVC